MELELGISVLLAGVGCFVGFIIYSCRKSEFGHPLKRNEQQKYVLVKKKILTHNTRRFTFQLSTPRTRLGLPVGGHVMMQVPGCDVERPYTPVTSDDDLGHFSCVIKIYPDGKMTPKLDELKVGDWVYCRGPLGTIRYPSPGLFVRKIGRKTTEIPCKQMNMIAGGTGITPMLQVASQIFRDENDFSKVSLIFGNVSDDDMLCYHLIEEMREKAIKKGKEFSVFYTLDKPPPGWTQGSGYVTPEMIAENFFPPGEDTVTLLCGPPPMVKGCKRSLESLGHTKSKILAF